ncbi:MAG: hypothetical protein HQK67_07225 [Desulfamplus sp.]|nr:hypothetical protein [Desulfamplus sp.]
MHPKNGISTNASPGFPALKYKESWRQNLENGNIVSQGGSLPATLEPVYRLPEKYFDILNFEGQSQRIAPTMLLLI